MVNRWVLRQNGWQRAIGRTVTGKELIAAAHAMEQMKSQAQFMKKLVGMLVITMCLLVACAGQRWKDTGARFPLSWKALDSVQCDSI